MKTLDQIFARFKQVGYYPITGEIAFEPLANALEKDETILRLMEGCLNNSVGLVIATDLRVFYIGVNKFKQTILEQISYYNILSIEVTEPKIISSKLFIKAKNKKELEIVGCENESATYFGELIRMLTIENQIMI